MKTIRALTFRLGALALLLYSGTPSSAQILYIQLVSEAPERFQLRQVNGDGSGDTGIGLPFSDVRFPTWSRDGGLFAFCATDPNRPNDRSYNIFAVNAATGTIAPVTLNQEAGTDPRTGAFNYVIAHYSAFSPDRNAMVVSSTMVTSNGQVGQTEATPVLEVYTAASRAAAAIVHVYRGRGTFTHHGGEGVDWHPGQNLLVAGVESSAPYQSNPRFSGGVTALHLIEPIDDAVNRGRSRQITAPRADQNPGFFRWGEHDHSPKFSANGVGLAYVRSFQNLDANGAAPIVQSLRILDLNTGADTEVIRLPQGGYVDSLDWSADGSALVFALGQQRTGINGPELSARPQTSELYVVNIDGTGLRRLRGASATTPAWKPFPPGVATPAGSNVVARSPSGDASVTFPSVSSGGSTTFVPINPGSAGAPPAGFTILDNGVANDITTTAAFAGPLTVCQTVNAINDGATFARVRILHSENGQLVDRTILAPDNSAPDFATRTVCARVGSLSPFVTALAPVPGPGKPRQLLNIATRLRVQTGENVLIGGIIITGNQPKRVILRAIGPSLAGVFAGALPDTTLELFAGDALLAANDNWKDSQQTEIEGTTIAPGNELESAIVYTLQPGSYTAVLSGKAGATGIGVIEVYDLDQAADAELANIASRGFVEAGENVMIGGLIVGGNGGQDARVLLRAIGPSLGKAGVAGALPDPTLELRDANGDLIRANDNWQESQAAEIEATTIPPSHPAESAIVATLPLGSYTAVVRGNNDSGGVGLVEVYSLR